MEYYLGVDQSFTSSGFVVMDETGAVIEHGLVKTKKSDTLDIFDRALIIADAIVALVQKYNPKFFAIEGLAFGMTGSATRDLAGLQFVVNTNLRRVAKYAKEQMIIVTPRSLKTFATQSGKADKEAMYNALPEDFKKALIAGNYKKSTGLYDLADAYWLANFCRLVGVPSEETT